MIRHPRSVPMTDDSMEIVQAAEQDFPYVAMEAKIELYSERQTPWHWHEYFETGIVSGGTLELCTRQGRVRVQPGEAYFLNANVLHQSVIDQNAVSVVNCAQLFGREIIATSGLVARRYVAAIENCVGLEVLHFKPEDAQQKAIIDGLRAAFEAAGNEGVGYELLIGARLAEVWAGIFRMSEPMLRQTEGLHREDGLRAKAMLSYIYENYGKAITVSQIAAAAGVCERECFRCFAQVLNTTPMQCLNRRRVSIAARALSESGDPVSEIAESCGFSNLSYFGKVFRKMMGCSPGEFRRKHR